MARKKVTEDDGLDAGYRESGEAAMAELDARDKEIGPYLAGDLYNYDQLINEIVFYNRQHVESGFEIGRRLIALKASLPYGQFGPQVLERVKISPSYASHLMAYARHVVELAHTSKGALDHDKLKSMDYRKVALLTELATESPEELEATGTIGGKTLDKWDAMSRKDLAATVRKQLQQIQDGAEQNQRVKDKLEKERDRVEDLLSATPNAVSESVTRMTQSLRDALASFEATANTDDDLEADSATILDLVGLRAQLRTFYDRANTLIEERFPAVLEAEIPADANITADANSLLKTPMPTKPRKGAKVQNISEGN